MTPCRRFEEEALLLLEQGEAIAGHFLTCDDCNAALASYDRLKRAMASIGTDRKPIGAWKAQIQAAVVEEIARNRSRRTWVLSVAERETGAAILFITHDLGVIAEMAQHVAVMYAGRVMEYADAKALFGQPKNPYTVGLLGSIPVLGRSSAAGRLQTIPGVVPSLLRLPEGCLFSDRCPDVFADCRRIQPGMYKVGENHFARCLKYA